MDTPPSNTTIRASTPKDLTKETLAQSLGVSVRGVENMLKKGQLPPGARVGRFLFWEENVIAKWREQAFSVQRGWQP